MSFIFDPARALESMEVQVMCGDTRWVFPLSGVRSFLEITRLHPLPPPANWDGVVRVEGLTCCVRLLKPSPDWKPSAYPLKACVVEKGKIPVVLAFERFVTGDSRPEFDPVGPEGVPFKGVTGRGQAGGMVCYHIDTGKLIV